jgi:hypothetical protein
MSLYQFGCSKKFMFEHSKDCIEAANEAARLALILGTDIRKYDTVFQLDTQERYFLIGNDPSQKASWQFEAGGNVVTMTSAAKTTVDETVADESERLALTGKSFGYVVHQTDDSHNYVLTDPAKISQTAGWTQDDNAGVWTGTNEDGYTQDVYFDGLLSDDVIMTFGASVSISDTAENKRTVLDNASLISICETVAANKMELWCSDYMPSAEVPLVLSVIR